MSDASAPSLESAAAAAFAARDWLGEAVASQAEKVARACHDMAVRFHRGGRLLVFGNGGPATDAQHIAVEFVHPVIVGKRALPAIALPNDVATVTGLANEGRTDELFAHQLRHLARADDIAMGVAESGSCRNVLRGLEAAAGLGLLTVALVGGEPGSIAASPDVEHVLAVPAGDPLVIKEAHVTLYHVLWELVHVFFEQPGLLEQAAAGSGR